MRFVIFVQISDIKTLGKVLAEEVRCTALQGFAILHHCFNRVGVYRTGKALSLAFFSTDDGNCNHVLRKIGIDVEHFLGHFACLFLSSVGGVAFLPQKFRGAEERTGSHFPTHHVAPLVTEDGQVAPTVNPAFISVPNHRFRSGTDNQFFFQLGSRVNDDVLAVFAGL